MAGMFSAASRLLYKGEAQTVMLPNTPYNRKDLFALVLISAGERAALVRHGTSHKVEAHFRGFLARILLEGASLGRPLIFLPSHLMPVGRERL